MVKVKASSKMKNKSRSAQCISTIRGHRAGPSKKFDAVASCCECGVVIEEDTKAVQCEKCIEVETWKCATCMDLSDELYDQLATSSKSNFHWFCEKCETIALDVKAHGSDNISPLFEKLHTKTDDIAQHLMDTLAKFEQNVLSRVGTVEQMLQKKAENDLLKAIEQRLQKIEDRPVDTVKWDETNVDTVQECVTKALDVKQQEDKEEEMELKRTTSVIVHGVAEPDATNSEERETEDVSIIAAMMHELDCDDAKVSKLIRLGKRPTASTSGDGEPKPRPIKLVLESEEQKVQVLRRAKNLRLAKEGGWEKVFIHQDLTPKQREARKLLVQEMKERMVRGEKDLMILNGKIIKRRPRIDSN